MDRLEATLERLFKFQVGKEPAIESTGLTSNTDKGIVDPHLLQLQVSSVKPNASKGGIGGSFTNETPLTRSTTSHETRKTHDGVPVMNVVNEEIEHDGVPVMNVVNEEIEVKQSEQVYRGYLQEMPFPTFDGTDPADWVMMCELYFDLYQIPDVHKTLLAVLHCSGTAIAWYRGVVVNKEHPPWAVLKEKVMEGFRNWGEMDPVEFKRLNQIGSAKEYIRNFERAMGRLLCEHPYISKPFFVSSFICGLKEEIKYMVQMFEPSTLNDAFHRAIHYEKHITVNLEEA